MKKRNRKKSGISLRPLVLSAGLIAFGWAALAAAQSESGEKARSKDKGSPSATRTIEGRVLTVAGAGVPGAVVLLKDNKTLQVRSYIAQTSGSYHFFGLSTDVNYTLRAENQGKTSKQKTVSVFDSHRQVKLDLKLSKEIKLPKIQQSKQE